MMHRALAIAVALGGVASCNGDRVQKAAPVGPTATGDAPGSGATPGSAAATPGPLPGDQRCLWLNVCDAWSGCAVVAQAGTGWKVITAERFAPGDPVEVLDMCSGEPVCISARGYPKGVICPPHTTTPFIAEPDYTCAWTGTACVRKPKPPKAQP